MPASARRARRRAAPGMLARRLALLALFEAEFRPGSAEATLERLAAEREVPDDVREHAERIVGGVASHRADLDRRIASEAPLIPVPELGRVERTILRSALYEVYTPPRPRAGRRCAMPYPSPGSTPATRPDAS